MARTKKELVGDAAVEALTPVDQPEPTNVEITEPLSEPQNIEIPVETPVIPETPAEVPTINIDGPVTVSFFHRGYNCMITRVFDDYATAQEFMSNPNNAWINGEGVSESPSIV